MHSSRIRTVRCSSRLLGGCLPGGCLPDTPLWTEWQTGVKTLPCCNYVADGNNFDYQKILYCDSKVQVRKCKSLLFEKIHIEYKCVIRWKLEALRLLAGKYKSKESLRNKYHILLRGLVKLLILLLQHFRLDLISWIWTVCCMTIQSLNSLILLASVAWGNAAVCGNPNLLKEGLRQTSFGCISPQNFLTKWRSSPSDFMHFFFENSQQNLLVSFVNFWQYYFQQYKSRWIDSEHYRPRCPNLV